MTDDPTRPIPPHFLVTGVDAFLASIARVGEPVRALISSSARWHLYGEGVVTFERIGPGVVRIVPARTPSDEVELRRALVAMLPEAARPQEDRWRP